MKTRQESTWDLFDAAFKIGDDVVLIDDNDNVIVGKLTEVRDDCCFIGDQWAYWNDIRFICHDGFPVKKLRGADGSKLIEKLDTTETRAVIRKALTTSVCMICAKLFSDNRLVYRTRCTKCVQVVFGDPFMAEAVSASLYNSGNSGSCFWQTEWEECLVLKAKDGAVAQVFDLSTVYYYGVES